MIYVALLRGINVGGNNKIEMKKLKSTFENLGFTQVSTYINSGNILFESPQNNPLLLRASIEKGIQNDFGLSIKVLLRNYQEMEHICQKLPENWVKNDIMRTDVMFLWEKFDKPDSIELLKITSVDRILYVPGAILWNVDGKDYNKSGMQKLVGSEIYRNMTIRNVNTFRKVFHMMTDMNDLDKSRIC